MLVHGVFNLSSYGDLLPGGRSLRFTMPLKLPLSSCGDSDCPTRGKNRRARFSMIA